MKYKNITELIGNTPLLEIDQSLHGLKNIDVYAKLELFNPWGSVKDRTAYGMLKDVLPQIQNGQKKVIELSSGNTAKALQILASINGSSFKTITNRIKLNESKDILKILGAEIEELPGKSDCYDPNDPSDPMVIINREIQKDPEKYFFTDQYTNENNFEIHYETTGQEILNDLGHVDYFIAGLGTTGSSKGITVKLKEHNKDLKTIGVVADKGDYIPGIRTKDEVMEVGLFEPSFYDEILSVGSKEAVQSMLELIRKSGILAGPTSGASFTGMIKYLKSIDPNLTERKTAVFIVCDRMEWYVSYIKERCPEIFGLDAKKDWKDRVTLESLSAVNLVKVNEAQDWIEKNKPLIIDIRTPLSFKVARIPGSINIPEENLSQQLNISNPFPRNKILFICPLGDKSKTFAAFIGKDAYNLEGGITAWRDNNLELERNL